MVPGGFSWFFMVPGWFFMVPVRFSWFFMDGEGIPRKVDDKKTWFTRNLRNDAKILK